MYPKPSKHLAVIILSLLFYYKLSLNLFQIQNGLLFNLLIKERLRRAEQTHQLNKRKGALLIMDMKLEVLFVPVSDVDRAKLFYEETGISLGYRRRQRGLPGGTIYSPRFGGIHHLR